MKRILMLVVLALLSIVSFSACPGDSDRDAGSDDSKAGAKTRKTLDAIEAEANK